MSSEKTSRVSRKEPRQLKELRSLLPWGWDARAVAHPPGMLLTGCCLHHNEYVSAIHNAYQERRVQLDEIFCITGKKTLRDFQECRRFLDPSTVEGLGSIGSSTAFRKRQKKV